ncbi:MULTISPECIES: hypothetical protein [Methylobacter]
MTSIANIYNLLGPVIDLTVTDKSINYFLIKVGNVLFLNATLCVSKS